MPAMHWCRVPRRQSTAPPQDRAAWQANEAAEEEHVTPAAPPTRQRVARSTRATPGVLFGACWAPLHVLARRMPCGHLCIPGRNKLNPRRCPLPWSSPHCRSRCSTLRRGTAQHPPYCPRARGARHPGLCSSHPTAFHPHRRRVTPQLIAVDSRKDPTLSNLICFQSAQAQSLHACT